MHPRIPLIYWPFAVTWSILLLLFLFFLRSQTSQDQFGRLRPTFIQVIDLTEQEEIEYRTVVSAVFQDKQITSIPSKLSYSEKLSSDSPRSTPIEASITNKVNLLRTMLQWEEQVRLEAGIRETKHNTKLNNDPNSTFHGEVVIVWWPHGEIMKMTAGSTAADIAIRGW